MNDSTPGSRPSRRRRSPALLLSLSLLVSLVGSAMGVAAQDVADRGTTVVFLVRHAEKEAAGEDPALTAAGERRARDLAHALKDAGIDRIHSTRTRRTMDTAAPLARALGLEVETYDGAALREIARRLRSEASRHLVVGHSNTTPELVGLLGGEPGAPIAEAWEYDRLYVVTLEAGGTARTVLLRFGEPARP